jgi:hypothetical protein
LKKLLLQEKTKYVYNHSSQIEIDIFIISFYIYYIFFLKVQIPVPRADISSHFLGNKFRRPKPDRPGCFTGYIQLATPKTIESMAPTIQTSTAFVAAVGENYPPQPLSSF